MRPGYARFLILGLCSIAAPAIAQTSPAPSAMGQSSNGGVMTGGDFAPVLDAQHRPITAGGFVDAGSSVFRDIAKAAGLTTWSHISGTKAKSQILETVGSGVALLDYDNDGWLDIYFVNGSTYEAMQGSAAAPRAALFHNNHDGTFLDVTEKAGVSNQRWGMGVAVGDYDNDGWPDLYVTNYGKNRLYHNNHDGTFTDVAEKAGVSLGGWSTGPTFGDYDGDGKLDLFVPGYVHYDKNQPPMPTRDAGSALVATAANCRFRNVAVFCGPRGLTGERDHLFHNDGDGTFTDVSLEAGVGDPHGYFGMTAVFVDLNNDGRPDLVVTNDSTPNYLYINQKDGRFEDGSYLSGYAFNDAGRETASMGVAVGDTRNNGLLDLLNTTFSDDYDVLYRNQGDADFTDVSKRVGIAEATIPFLGWGVGFLDFDNDGWLDIFIANGHVYPAVDQNNWGTTFAERPLLFRNLLGNTFEGVPPIQGTGLSVVIPARGAAFGDLFNDGKTDVVINNMDASPTLLRNVNPDHHHWVELKLIGGPKSPRDAVGATVYLTSGLPGSQTRQRADVLSGGSYASSNDQRVHFGLGDKTTIAFVEIHWPSGSIETRQLTQIDSISIVEEGKGPIDHVANGLFPTLHAKH